MYINNVRKPMIYLMTLPSASTKLTSASDLETTVKNKGRVKKNIISLPID